VYASLVLQSSMTKLSCHFGMFCFVKLLSPKQDILMIRASLVYYERNGGYTFQG
jgi:hypothetical protein